MPVLQNEQRKQIFLTDIESMFSLNKNFTKGKENPNFVKNFTEVRNYFAKGKTEDSRQLAGYVQNFINVYQNLEQSYAENGNEYSSQMLNNIQSMANGFRKAYDKYIKDNKYTALKNDNVKALSAMVQTAENMGHRVEMETRSENVEFVCNQLENEREINRTQVTDFNNFALECEKNEIDFVDPETQLNENKREYETLSKNLVELKKLQENLATDSDTSKDTAEINECTQKLLEHKLKQDNAKLRAEALLFLRNELNNFQAESLEVRQQLNEYSSSISEYKDSITDADAKIAQEQKKVAEGNIAKAKRDKLELNSEDVYNHGQATQQLTDLTESISFMNDLNRHGIKPSEFVAVGQVSPNVRVMSFQYEKYKGYMCSQFPKLNDEFSKMEAGEKSITQFLKDNNDLLMNGKGDLEQQISRLERSKDYKDYIDAIEKISIGEASNRNIQSLNAQKAQCEKDIKLKEECIVKTKLKSDLGDRIKKTLGTLPEKPITEKKLIEAMNKARQSSLDEFERLQKSSEPQKLGSRIETAKQRINDKNVALLSSKISTTEAQFKAVEQKQKLLEDAVKKHKIIASKTDSILSMRDAVKVNRLNDSKLDPNKEVYDRLMGIKERFGLKSNNKFTEDCRRMMEQLDHTIAAFNPDSEESISSDVQKTRLEELQRLSGEYIKAKNDQHIPKWFASEQRLLRLSCAEEMQSFAAIANKMVSDVAQNEHFERVSIYANTPCDEKLKNRIINNNMKQATKGGSLARLFNKFSDAKKQRDVQQNTRSLNDQKKDMQSMLS